ncbi:GNAT family N-acetyltransferase [bacterium]|nr:GNAT family N-acetyltransferase [bacterium]
MKNPYLVGNKVYLRALEREDAPLVIAYLNDQAVRRTLLHVDPLNVPAEEEFLEKAYKSPHEKVILGIAKKDGDALIGMTGLHDLERCSHTALFGIVIGAKDEWGKGYGSEATALMVRHAFETLNMNRVWLLVHEDNAGGIRAYEKAGFRREGLLRQHAYREGRYVNEALMGVLREEWDAARPRGS